MAPFFASHPLLMGSLIVFAILFAVDVVSGYALSDPIFGDHRR